eukprot:487414_1
MPPPNQTQHVNVNVNVNNDNTSVNNDNTSVNNDNTSVNMQELPTPEPIIIIHKTIALPLIINTEEKCMEISNSVSPVLVTPSPSAPVSNKNNDIEMNGQVLDNDNDNDDDIERTA